MSVEVPRINGRAWEMLAAMVADPGEPGTFYADRLGASNSNAIQIRNRLRDLSLIEKHGDGRACRWTPTALGTRVVEAGPSSSAKSPRPKRKKPAALEPPRPEDGPSSRPKQTASRKAMKAAIKRRIGEVDGEIVTTKIRLVELRAVKTTLEDELDAMEDRCP